MADFAGSNIDLIGFAYASLVAAGGLLGYFKAGSLISLISGLGFGASAGFSSYLVSVNNNHIGMLGVLYVKIL